MGTSNMTGFGGNDRTVTRNLIRRFVHGDGSEATVSSKLDFQGIEFHSKLLHSKTQY